VNIWPYIPHYLTYWRGVLYRGRTRNAVIFVKIGSVKSHLTDVHSEFLVYVPHYLAHWSEVLYRGWTRNAVIFVKIGSVKSYLTEVHSEFLAVYSTLLVLLE
jgi:glutamine amidotransferase-like uncharacterized protein